MEKKNIEVINFSKRSNSYKNAHTISKKSRLFETVSILSIIEGYLKTIDKRKEDIVLVDLISGSGYFTNLLVKCGFKNIHCLEACDQLIYDNVYYTSENISMHEIDDVRYCGKLLKSINPDIIIAVASFHHLLIRNYQNQIDNELSIKFQADTLDLCMNSLKVGGIIIVEDLIADDVFQKEYKKIKYFDSLPLLNLLDKEKFQPNIYNEIINSNSFSKFADVLKNNLYNGNSLNPSKEWLETVVNKFSPFGHEHCVLTDDLIRISFTKYGEISFETYYPSWTFNDRNDLLNFILNLFGFIYPHKRKVSDQELLEYAQRINGINPKGDLVFFGWSLGILMIEKK